MCTCGVRACATSVYECLRVTVCVHVRSRDFSIDSVVTATVGEVYLTHTRFINNILILHRVVFTTMCFMNNWDIYQRKLQTTSAQWLICRCGCHVTESIALVASYYTVLLAALNIASNRSKVLIGWCRPQNFTNSKSPANFDPHFPNLSVSIRFSLPPPPPPPTQCSVSIKPNWSSIIICNQSMTVLPPPPPPPVSVLFSLVSVDFD